MSRALAHEAWLIPKMADCGGDQCKSGQDQKRKQRPKNKGQTFLSKLPIIPVLLPGFASTGAKIGHRILKLDYMPRDN